MPPKTAPLDPDTFDLSLVDFLDEITGDPGRDRERRGDASQAEERRARARAREIESAVDDDSINEHGGES